ncbi:unnamed protein product [Clavelina lepadiformis]|uniref:Uncharacterized protein n=1 Tax=Clavelina lepadiformis TaxID=159417 RepID=A0ABP0FBK2_CLALP
MRVSAKNFINVFLVAALLSFSVAKQARKSQNMEPVDVKQWGLPEDKRYVSVREINTANFKSKVLESDDAWIVVLYRNKLSKKWKQHAEELLGSIWYGKINVDEEQELAKKLAGDLKETELMEGTALVFPFGKSKTGNVKKTGKWPQKANEPHIAEEMAKGTIPDRMRRLTFTPGNMNAFQDWIVTSYYKDRPPRFPILCITDKREPIVPALFLVLSHYFADFFSFALMRKSYVQNMRSHFKEVPVPKTYPHYLLLLGKEPTGDDMYTEKLMMSFDIIPFISDKYGKPGHFSSVVKYLFTANDDFRKELPGRSSNEHRDITQMTYARNRIVDRIKTVSKVYKSKEKDEL